MKILLIYPRLNYPTKAVVTPPLGILYIASVLKNEGYDVDFLDLTNYSEMPDIEPFLKDVRIVGMSVPSVLAQKAFEIAEIVKRHGIFLVAGGPHATALPEQTLKSGFDAVVIGEGEKTIVELVKAVEKGQDLINIKGIALIKDGKLVLTESRPYIEDLDELPEPARELVDWPLYYSRSVYYDAIIASRGCPYRCFFCKPMQDNLFGKKVRYRSQKSVFKEIASYKKIWERYSPFAKVPGMKFLFGFSDDMFLSKHSWVDNFCNEIMVKGVDFWWGCNSRIDAIREEQLKRMIDAGCKIICFGVESGSQRTLDFLRKDLSVSDICKALQICNKLDIITNTNIIIGSPEETREDLEATYNLLKENRPTTCLVSRATAHPGAYLYEYAKERGLLQNEVFDERFDYFYTRRPLKLKYLTEDDLDEYEHKISSLFSNDLNMHF